MRTIAASGLVALTAMLGVAASMAVASPATAGQRPTTAASAKAVNPVRAVKPLRAVRPAKAPPPANQLYGVSCPSANDCVALGINENAADTAKGGGALIQTWNGKTWTRMSFQPPASAKDDADLIGVSCTAAKNCVAVGVGGDGATAACSRSPSSGTARPGAVGFIDADFNDGGHTGKAASTSWNGKTWTATSGPAPGKGKASLFSEVSCPAAGGCAAVGQLGPYNSDEGSGLAGSWNGKSWKLGTTP
jgi:hypothetical protein